MTITKRLILGFCALLHQSFNRAGVFLRVTILWVLLLPYLFYGAGSASNQAVLITNDDTFPVRINLIKLYDWSDKGKLIKVDLQGHVFTNDNMHVVMNDHTRLNWLADNFDFHTSIMSVGDFLIYFSEWLSGFCVYVWIALVVKSLYQRRRHDDETA